MSVLSNLLSANTSGIETDASGWTAGANTSLARSTTRFYQGAASLQLTATAAGTVTATTATRVAVTPGTVYQAYGFFANVVAASGRTASVKITWYAGAVGGTALSTSTGTANTLANATTWNTPPPQLLATAPAGAGYATMTITVTGLTAGAQVVADLMVFGEPNAFAGNLIPYADASVEGDASGWDPSWNVTLSRTQPTAWEGWYSLVLTSVAAGSMQATLLNTVPVTAGREYVGHVQVQPGVSSDFRVQINWYGANGLVGVTEQLWTALSAGAWMRASVIGVAPQGATSALLALKPIATAAGQTWLCDQMTIKPAPLLAGSVLGYNAQSTEVDASAWSATSGCTIARSTSRSWEGAASLAITTDGSSTAVVRLNGSIPVTPGKAYKVVPYFYHGLKSSTLVVDLIFRWLRSDSTEIDTTTFHWQTAAAAGWYTPTGGGVAPPGAASVEVSVGIVSPGADTYYIDNVFVGPGGVGVAAEPIEDAYGAQISMQGLTTGGHTYWGLWRVEADGALTAVRGESGDLDAVPITSDLAVAQDYEAALGVEYRYLLRLHSSDTAWIRSMSRPLTLPEPPATDVVIKDPGQPARQAVLAVQTLPDWSSSARQGVNVVRGRRTPIVISDVRASRTGTLTLITRDARELTALRWVLETGNTLLLQWPNAWEESDLYVQVGDVSEAHIVPDATAIERTWSLPLTEVDRPIGGMVGSAARTWADVLAGSEDWLAVYTTAANWLAVYSGAVGV